MEMIYKDDSMSMNDLAESLGLTNGAISMHVGKLEEAGLVRIKMIHCIPLILVFFDFSFFDFRFFDFSFLILVSLFLLYNISIVKTKTNVKSILANAKYLSQNNF